MARGEKEEAIETVKYATSLNPNYPDGHCRLAQIYLLLGKEELVQEPLDACMDKGGTKELKSARLLMDAINYYVNQQDLDRALLLTERLSLVDANNPEVWFNLARLYLELNYVDEARVAGRRAAALDSRLQEMVTELLGE